MFERYLTDALTTHFGHFVENLDADNVRLSAWNGELVFKDLSLRPNALDHLVKDCPIEIAHGQVGNLELRIPWSLFRSHLRGGHASKFISTTSPCSIVLSDVNILITPRRRNEDDSKARQESSNENDEPDKNETQEERRTRKEKEVQAMLDGQLLKRVTESSAPTTGRQSRLAWVREWLAALLSTLSVTVRNIHIRYEDPGTCMGFVWDTTWLNHAGSSDDNIHRNTRRYRPAFAIGITLRQFSVQSEEANEDKVGNGKDEPKSSLKVPLSRHDARRKVAAAERLAVYWDSDCNLMVEHAKRLCDKDSTLGFSTYFQSAFQITNKSAGVSVDDITTSDTEATNAFPHEKLYQQPHAYVLDPISPLVDLTLVSSKDSSKTASAGSIKNRASFDSLDESDDSSIEGSAGDLSSSAGPQHEDLVPPSTIKVHLPPCDFALDRSTLEDVAYIRKSLSVWKHATKGVLSESALRRLAKLRPSQSPKDNPLRWWWYAVEASLALSRSNQDDIHSNEKSADSARIKRRRGWMGFWEAFQRRKRYIALYHALMPSQAMGLSDMKLHPSIAHQKLLEMEDDLLIDEIVSFRLALNERPQLQFSAMHGNSMQEEGVPTPRSGWQIWSSTSDSKSKRDTIETDNDVLSVEHRISRLRDMMSALKRERNNTRRKALVDLRQETKRLALVPGAISGDLDVNPVIWKAFVSCRELALQINDETRKESLRTPVIRFSCAWVQDQSWYLDDSWEIDSSLASIVVKDLTLSKMPHEYFPDILTQKLVDSNAEAQDSNFVWIEGQRYHRGLSIAVQRKLHWDLDEENNIIRDVNRGSTTTSRVRILPLEVVYSTVPVEVATRVLGSVKTPELVDDYQRMAAAAHSWQERQKKKLLAALAHKKKKIVVDIDVGAPELLVPEDIQDPESPMLAIDFGRLRFFNDHTTDESLADYDDHWRLVISNIQVRSATVASFGQPDSATSTPLSSAPRPKHLVEPFSLEFSIATKIAEDEPGKVAFEQTKIHMVARLPRLAFNLNSSSIRLVARLRKQFERRRRTKVNPKVPPVVTAKNFVSDNMVACRIKKASATEEGAHRVEKHFQFDFTAPVISLRLEKDLSDPKAVVKETLETKAQFFSVAQSTPLLDLAFRGISGTVLQQTTKVGHSSTRFDARLHSLGAIDLYQNAGKDFSLLLASSTPDTLAGLVCDGDIYTWRRGQEPTVSERTSERKDLVTIQYFSIDSTGLEVSESPSRLAIWFNELYVEWNPETLATIQSALSVPEDESKEQEATLKMSSSDDEFFDAVEDPSIGSSFTEGIHLVSEVSSSSFETAKGEGYTHQSSMSPSVISLGLQQSFSGSNPLSPPRNIQSSVAPLSPHRSSYPLYSSGSVIVEPENQTVDGFTTKTRSFEMTFELSKLRVSFNKETRHRKVMIAQMDGTKVRYSSGSVVGSRTRMQIDNLIFSDPASLRNATLYDKILGLKSSNEEKTSNVQLASLLEMEILINPKTRRFDCDIDGSEDIPTQEVTINRERGIATGGNNYVQAKFSPMRFVFLEQLWFEFIDYFFEGIIGDAVWSGKIKKKTDLDIEPCLDKFTPFLPGSDASGFNFTRFVVELESPEILFPVAYRSPQFLKLNLDRIQILNKYNTTLIGDNSETRMQWFNNASISLRNFRLFSWNGKELGKAPVTADVSLRWPIGPLAPLVTPKWVVDCHFGRLDLLLRRVDYALIQHIISHNIGEPSRHLEEWNALQNLSPADFLAFSQNILVHFGYDKKDITPTTYDLKVHAPSVTVDFNDSDNDADTPVAIARCIGLVWNLRKDRDLISKQKATFDINLTAPSSNSISRKLLSSWKYDQNTLMEDIESENSEDTPELTYSSVTLPSGNSTRTLEILDACIYSDIQAWRVFGRFFSDLPGPDFYDEDEIGSLIQVGDRWYKINAHPNTGGSSCSEDPALVTLEWIRGFTRKRNDATSGKGEAIQSTEEAKDQKRFQLRVALTSPRIILSSEIAGDAAHLVLRMSHLDFLSINSGHIGLSTRSFLLDGVEVYTLSRKLAKNRSTRENENSLIHPWSVCGMVETSIGQTIGTWEKHSIKVSAGVLKARASYSDMAIAIGVGLSVAHSAKEDDPPFAESESSDMCSQSSNSSGISPGLGHSFDSDATNGRYRTEPRRSQIDLECEGFELLVADDSGRHFASKQELIIVSLGKCLFHRRQEHGQPSSMYVWVEGFDLYDCLQPMKSPFRTAATTKPPIDVPPSKANAGKPMDFNWDDFKTQGEAPYTETASSATIQRLSLTSKACAAMVENVESSIPMATGSILLSSQSSLSKQKYAVKLFYLSVQWNPSTVIAIQRFLGRLRKESKSKISEVLETDFDDLIVNNSMDIGEVMSSPSHSHTSGSPVMEISAELHELKVCLNKEHQNRRLIELVLTDSRLDLHSSARGLAVNAIVGSLSIWDCDNYSGGIESKHRQILKVTKPKIPHGQDDIEFLHISYQTFKETNFTASKEKLPAWVKSHLSKIGGIDDFLRVRVAATEMIYLKERTEELIDYLSNGLPGKGMGVTSRAAKGFIRKRILTKSFLDIKNASPEITLPQHETCSNGVSFKLGDVGVRSYFERDEDSHSNESNPIQDWWRVLALDISGFQVGAREESIFSPLTSPIDLSISLRKQSSKSSEFAIRGKLSFVDLTLKYSHYVLALHVAKDNLGRKINAERWDNVEKAYWLEENGNDQLIFPPPFQDSSSTPHSENQVSYSANARLVRYGKAGKRTSKIAEGSTNSSPSKAVSSSVDSTVDVKFVLDGLSLKLTRDDLHVPNGEDLSSEFIYDIVLLRVQIVEIAVVLADNGYSSFNLSMFRLGFFDLGEKGRLLREHYQMLSSTGPRKGRKKSLRLPCSFQVIAEGYAPVKKEYTDPLNRSGGATDEPQFVVSVERRKTVSASEAKISDLDLPLGSKITVARMVVNYLSLNVMVRPIKESMSFLAQEWPMPKYELRHSVSTKTNEGTTGAGPSIPSKQTSEGFQLKLVAHYPRIFFLADESDLHSRALVLRGLAVINLNKTVRVEETANLQQTISVNGQFQSMESYINADVYEALRFTPFHAEMVGPFEAKQFPSAYDSGFNSDSNNTLGVALIQPVTAGVEFVESKRDLFPTERSIFVNIEPVSTMLSFEDLNLIETVLARLSTKESKQDVSSMEKASIHANMPSPYNPDIMRNFRNDVLCHPETYQVSFATKKIGLGLKAGDENIVVSSIQNDKNKNNIRVGDTVLLVGTTSCSGQTLENVVAMLADSKRPVVLTFRRKGIGAPLSEPSTETDSSLLLRRSERYSVASFEVKLKTGVPNGLNLTRSACSGFPVVAKVSPAWFFATSALSLDEDATDQVEAMLDERSVRPPRPGTVVVGINGFSAEDIGMNDLWDSVNRFACDPDERSDLSPVYSLTFQEIDSKLWGTVDKINISSSGFTLSFIDDLHGRDMPLFRGKLDALDVHAVRCLAGKAEIIEVQQSSILQLSRNHSHDFVDLDFRQLEALRSEVVTTIFGIAVCSVDYFHPRVAVWEPLVEPSQLFLFFESQAGCPSSGRPGQVAIELSERVLRGQSFHSHVGASPSIVSLNISDSSAEVTVKALTQWKEWRAFKSTEPVDTDEEAILKDELGFQGDDIGLIHSLTSQSDRHEIVYQIQSGETSGSIDIQRRLDSQRDAKRAAAQRAAQAALVFAKKRGAVNSKKGVAAKPFVLRNRTGVSIAFVQQCNNDPRNVGRKSDCSHMSTVGEYEGLGRYDSSSIRELADMEDAKFSMEVISDKQMTGNNLSPHQSPSSKVRSYEGRFPSLTIAIQAVSGVTIQPLEDLQVYQVGTTVRYLTVRKQVDDERADGGGEAHFSVPVVWKVEIEDNRRVLTLSTAVRIVTTAFSTQIEISVQEMASEESARCPFEQKQSHLSIGVVKPESPFYLPLWVALKLDPVDVFLRPLLDESGSSRFEWGSSSILRFAPLANLHKDYESEEPIGTWVWEETFEELDFVRCDTTGSEGQSVWLAVFSGSSNKSNEHSLGSYARKRTSSTMVYEEEHTEVISVTVDSCLTLRNMLPLGIEWQYASSASGEPSFASTEGTCSRSPPPDVIMAAGEGPLDSGECTEIFSCDYQLPSLQARFKPVTGEFWSNWAELSLNDAFEVVNASGKDGDSLNMIPILPTARQVNIQIPDDEFGVPLTFGVRVVPKVTSGNLNEAASARVYGVEVIVYAELWIRNITSLPLNFGCPTNQSRGVGTKKLESFSINASRFNAESALMEIASLLEVGDKGTGIHKQNPQESAATGIIERLPNQECGELWEEVFEYLEIEHSTVKRRWWALECYDSFRMNITQTVDGANWSWLDDKWTIDISGNVDAEVGGWESTPNLRTNGGSFTSNRKFNPTHSFRRRRYFRCRSGIISNKEQYPASSSNEIPTPWYRGGLQAIHQPLTDSFTREQKTMETKTRQNKQTKDDSSFGNNNLEVPIMIAVKCADGRWSLPISIPGAGTNYGVVRVLSSRWPALSQNQNSASVDRNLYDASRDSAIVSPFKYQAANMSSKLFELCYSVADAEGEWGEFSRLMTVCPRFMVRNDSERFSIELKQAGTDDRTSLKLEPGAAKAFYWEDFRLPGLVCVCPCMTDAVGNSVYRWSGGFDICNLGMVPLKIRRSLTKDACPGAPVIRSIRALVEIRPGTGGLGVNVSFREENPFGDGSLFRLENRSPFPVWFSQDGVLANPMHMNWHSDDDEASGDMLDANDKSAFSLDVPYRQGKYANRREATVQELLQLRIALAPLASRAGVETVKVINVTKIGESVMLNPSKLFGILKSDMRSRFDSIRVVALVCSDGPTRVLKLVLVQIPHQDVIIGNTIREVSYMASKPMQANIGLSSKVQQGRFHGKIQECALSALSLLAAGKVPSEEVATREAFFDTWDKPVMSPTTGSAGEVNEMDMIYSVRAEFGGFLFSLIDSAPSEIAVVSIRNLNALARWNKLRTNEASLICSVGWLQVDNHVPSAPFKVAIRPDSKNQYATDEGSHSESDDETDPTLSRTPLLMVAVAFAPTHKSGILCLRSVTVAPRNLVIALDLAFLVRLQRYLLGLRSHFRPGSAADGVTTTNGGASLLYAEQKRNIAFPKIMTAEEEIAKAAAFGTENQNLYFQGLKILPAAIRLSVAPARALTPEQASLEGNEVAAIHQAVRKGDILVGSSSALLGVRVGRKNTTPLAVVRGVFKSIVVDALLRLDGASLQFSGVALRNHISTGPQLTTFLIAHYLASLRQNVPALLGSLAAFGNPLGLIRGLGDGVSDFVYQPVRGLKKSVKELDPIYLVDGVARGTGSLARHAVGGFADSASLLTETFSKNMAVLTLDRRYAQRRDRSKQLRLNTGSTVTLAGGVESGFVKLVEGFMEGVTGVVRAPMRGAEKRGIEGFAKGMGKGLLGLLVKPMIGISDAATDVMIGVKNTVENTGNQYQNLALGRNQVRPRRPMYGRDQVLRPYKLEDAAAAALMLRTRCAGENYLSHLDLGDRVALLSVKRFILIGPKGQELMVLKYKHVSKAEVRQIPNRDNTIGWAIIIVLSTPRRNGSEVEVLACNSRQEAAELCSHIQRGIDLVSNDGPGY